MQKWLLPAITAAVCVVASGCTSRSDFNAISSKNVNLDNLKLHPSKSKDRTEGEDCTPIILIFAIGMPNLENAVDYALDEGGGNVLVDEVTTLTGFYIPLLFGMNCMKVEGTALRTRQL